MTPLVHDAERVTRSTLRMSTRADVRWDWRFPRSVSCPLARSRDREGNGEGNEHGRSRESAHSWSVLGRGEPAAALHPDFSLVVALPATPQLGPANTAIHARRGTSTLSAASLTARASTALPVNVASAIRPDRRHQGGPSHCRADTQRHGRAHARTSRPLSIGRSLAAPCHGAQRRGNRRTRPQLSRPECGRAARRSRPPRSGPSP